MKFGDMKNWRIWDKADNFAVVITTVFENMSIKLSALSFKLHLRKI
jgi:hypothetical protein